MKKLFLICAAAFALSACSDEEFAAAPAPDDGRVRVDFRMEVDLDTDTSLRPMTRMTSYTNFMLNRCRMLLLRKIDTRWIVEGVKDVLVDPEKFSGAELRLESPALPQTAFGLELRPGDYRAVAVLNAGMNRWNNELVAGTVVYDSAAPSQSVPPLLTYSISEHPANTGYRQLNREVFVAVADFTVPKSGDLHSAGMPPIGLHAERRVGKFRILLKNVPSPVTGINFITTAYTAHLVFTFDGPFPEGIDALGGTYYSQPGQTELPWCMSTAGGFHPSCDGEYQMCQSNSTVFSPFVFLDPKRDETPVTLSVSRISGQSGGIWFDTDETYRRTFAVNKTTGIVFKLADDFDEDTWMAGVVESTDAEGVPEDAATLFDPYYEWNAMSYSKQQ